MSSAIIPEFWMPENIAATPTVATNTTFDAPTAGDYVAFIFSMPETKVVRSISFTVGPVTVSNKTVELRLESVVGGVPSGNLLAPLANGQVLVTVSTNNVDYARSFTADISITAGTLVACVLRNVGGGSGTLPFLVYTDGMSSSGLPYAFESNSGSTSTRFGISPLIALYNDSGEAVRIRHAWPIKAASGENANSSIVLANKIRNYGVGYRISGIKFWANIAQATTISVYLFDESRMVLASATVPSAAVTAGNTREIYFSSPVTVSSDYYVGITNTSVSGLTIYYEDYQSSITRKGSPFGGNHIIGGFTATGVGAPTTFTEVSLRSYYIAPIITGFDYNTAIGTTSKTFAV